MFKYEENGSIVLEEAPVDCPLKNLRTHALHVAMALTSHIPDDAVLEQFGDRDRGIIPDLTSHVPDDGDSEEFIDRDPGMMPEWHATGEWLSAAAGIGRIEYTMMDRSSLMDDMGLCEPATEYFDSRDKLQRNFISALTRFSLIWNSFEAAAELITPRGSDKSAINKARAYILRHFDGAPFEHFEGCVLGRLKEHVKQSAYKENLIGLFNFGPGAAAVDGGMRVVQEIRNTFAHGGLDLPDDVNEHPVPVCIINLSSRIVLMGIQALIWCRLKQMPSFRVEASYINGGRVSELRPLLETIHLQPGKSSTVTV